MANFGTNSYDSLFSKGKKKSRVENDLSRKLSDKQSDVLPLRHEAVNIVHLP